MNRIKHEDIVSLELGQEYAQQCNNEMDRLEQQVNELTQKLREQARLIVNGNSNLQKEKTPKVELNKIKIERKY